MGTGETNPIARHLTRTIDHEKLRTQILIGKWLPVVVVSLIYIAMIYSAAIQSYSVMLAGLAIYSALLAILPPAAGAISATVTHRAVHNDSFELLWLTTIPAKDMAAGFVEGVRARLEPIYAATNSLILSGVVGAVITYLLFGESVNLLRLFVFVMTLVIFPWLFWLFEREWVRMGMLAGIYCTFRLRNMSIGGVSAMSVSVITGLQVFWPMLVLIGTMVTMGVIAGIIFVFLIGATVVLPYFASSRLNDLIEQYIIGARQHPEMR